MHPNTQKCCFCEEIGARRLSLEFRQRCGLDNRIFAESDGFVALPSVSPLCLGHVLILPKAHVTSMLQLSQYDAGDLQVFLPRILRRISELFGVPFIFEHGVGREKVGGCGVNHAHIHILPAYVELTGELERDIQKDLVVTRRTWKTLPSLVTPDKSYLMFCGDLEEVSVVIDEHIRSQYLRKAVAHRLGKTISDWRELYGWDEFRSTYERLTNTASF